jgi:hypothetical protein
MAAPRLRRTEARLTCSGAFLAPVAYEDGAATSGNASPTARERSRCFDRFEPSALPSYPEGLEEEDTS